MDEFNKLPEEFTPPGDEFNEHLNIKKTKKVNKRREKNIIKYLCASSAVLLTFPTYFGVFDVPENKIKEESVIIENNNQYTQNNNTDIKNPNSNNNTVPDKEAEIEEDNKVQTIQIRVDCDLCEGTGIICPGDPNFGYDRGNGYGYEGCHGTGFSPCPDIWCHDGVKTCQSCKGSGIYQDDTCEFCHGKGIVDCEFCNNTGMAKCICEDSHTPCEKCKGNGYYYEERVVD